MTKEEAKAMLEELNQQIIKVNETIKAFNAKKGAQQILRIELGDLYDEPQVHCLNMESILKYDSRRKRSSDIYPVERSVVVDGVKYFELAEVG